ncbi:hypothetical protein ATEIFO6365_0005002500 [Aspergillus terreus]|uniref:Uncharacterized protein n=1 Tax=Aspergillus terreus TaxID=33178 RepID=A0A5M3Z3V1_ASPTE|nr:hypothetical protein ATETN484_0007000500 [Aspergillus terreus]GFF15835.1 hypothetical protein ATEIFO6365_0005002500 [Aspergillus terreus]
MDSASYKKSQAPRELKIKWPKLGATITVKMNNLNPSLSRLLGTVLPYYSLQTHAVVAGDQLYHLVPLEQLIYTPADYKAPDRAKEPDGSVFLSSFQHLVIKYGNVTEHQPVATCGRVIDEDLKTLHSVANQIWKRQCEAKEPIEVVVWDASKPEPNSKDMSLSSSRRTGVSKEVRDFVRKIYKEIEKSWSSISKEIEKLHHGEAPEKPGSKDSYFGAMVFSNSVVRTLGYHILDNILKLAATRPQFTLPHLIILFRELVPPISEFTGHLGIESLRDSYLQADILIKENIECNPNHKEAREDFLAIVSALGFYVNLLNAQNLHMFPWKHANEYQIR